MTRLTRTSFLSVFLFSLLISTAQPVSAQSFLDLFRTKSSVEQNVSKTSKAVVNSAESGIPSLESNVDDTLLSLQTSALIMVAGPDESTTASMTPEQRRLVQERYGGGAINGLTTAMSYLYSPPASGRTYVADALESAKIIPEAQAQGLGFSALDPILDTWKIFRNVAYLFFVVVFLVIGFMIMFRQKIGGQTVVTAQQAIPGVIVSLIFVTFSYAIAGFLIDLMYLLMYLMIGLFQPGNGTEILSQNFFEVGLNLITKSGGAFATVNSSVQQFVGAIELAGVQDALGFIAGITLALIVSIAVLIGIFKLFFELLKTYVTIIISIATAPMTLMIGAVPGQNNFGKWLKSLIGNLMAFPTVLLALILFKLFTREGGGLESGGFVPPFLIGGGQGQAVLTLVGIGVILVMPELVKEVKKAMGVEGGIWEQLGTQAAKNVQSGEVLIPGALGAGYGLYGAGTGFAAARQQKLGFRDTLSGMFGKGVRVESGKEGEAPRYVGGALGYAGRGLKTGQNIRRRIDRLQEGRLTEAEDFERAVEQMAERFSKNPNEAQDHTPPAGGSKPSEEGF